MRPTSKGFSFPRIYFQGFIHAPPHGTGHARGGEAFSGIEGGFRGSGQKNIPSSTPPIKIDRAFLMSWTEKASYSSQGRIQDVPPTDWPSRSDCHRSRSKESRACVPAQSAFSLCLGSKPQHCVRLRANEGILVDRRLFGKVP